MTNSDFASIKSPQDLEIFLNAQGIDFKIPDPERITNTN